jgi:hypothetical protein
VCPPEEGVGLEEFTTEILYRLALHFPNCPVGRGWGDPAGEVRDGVYERTSFEFMLAKGLKIMGAGSNDPADRIHAIKAPCGRMIDGKPGLLVHKRCVQLIKALKGGWKFKRVTMGGGEDRFRDVPDKDKYSHVADALGYLLLGAGEGKARRDDSRRLTLPATLEHDFQVL